MRYFVPFLLLLVCLGSFHAFADNGAVSRDTDNMIKGKIGTNQKVTPYTDKELDEAIKVSDDCKAYEYTNTRYDCDCVGLTFLDLRKKAGSKGSSYWLREEANRKCPNAPAMAGKIYSECLGWAPRQRDDDYNEFCSCYGSSFAKIYSKNPSENLLVTEAQTTKAMMDCDVNSVNRRTQEREAFVKKLKDSKIYYQLFPGAKN